MNTILLDPAHGGTKSGVSNHVVKESDIVLDISRNLFDLFVDLGYQVKTTRSSDSDVHAELRASKVEVNDILISIHAGEPLSVWYHADNLESYKLAEYIRSMLYCEMHSDFERYPGAGYSILRSSLRRGAKSAVLLCCGELKEVCSIVAQAHIAELVSTAVSSYSM